MRRRTEAAFVSMLAAGLCLGLVSGHAQSRSAGLSPAALALAATDSAPNLDDLLRQALGSDQPDLRWTAARVAFVSNLPQLAPDIARVLDRETHPQAEAAEVRALVAFGGAAARDALEAWSARATGRGRPEAGAPTTAPEIAPTEIPTDFPQVMRTMPVELPGLIPAILGPRSTSPRCRPSRSGATHQRSCRDSRLKSS